MKTIKITFAQDFDYLGIQEKLGKFFEVQVIDNADYVISNEHAVVNVTKPKKITKYPVRVFYTGENVIPDFNIFDYAISFEQPEFGDRHITYPLCY